ncbi:MAG: ion transporter [Flavobacteriales bacterium]|nr:ion transporter [Flavobacteriales bacterium]MCB9197027.1 ion transporter [Flavobacteriales bacterium]
MNSTPKNKLKPWQNKMHEVIFEADTFAGKLFDIVLLIFIVLSVSVVMLESISSVHIKYGTELYVLEWGITILFTLEFIARLLCVHKPIRYIFSFYGVVDLLALLPSYIGVFVTGTHSLSVIRSLRLLRIFRILKLAHYIGEANLLIESLKASKAKIVVFMFFVMSLTFILGSLMYIIESPESGFTSIPKSVYWAIVTMTTVGYGDIYPETNLGQFIASVIMITGYAIIAVPTGIISAEIAKQSGKSDSSSVSTQVCPHCSSEGHDKDATYCKYCGSEL